MSKSFIILVMALCGINCSPGKHSIEGCFTADRNFYYVATQCVDASLYWHSTVERHGRLASGISVDEFIVDQEWWNILVGRNPVSRVLLIGTGALDEVPKVLVISSGKIKWKNKKVYTDSEDVRGTVLPVLVEDKIVSLRIMENLDVYVDSYDIH